jgi:glycosyltransferase involved in cell wall biosynthesis
VYTRLLLETFRKQATGHTFTTFTPRDGIPHQADLVHYPYFDPFFLTLPARARVPFVVTVHDLIPIVFPKHFPRGVRGEIKWQVQRYRLRRAAHIITDSRASQRDVSRYVGVPKERISPIHLAPAPTLKPDTGKLTGWPESYFLYVGDLNWNKNVDGLISAFSHIRSRGKSLHLVLVGDAFTKSDLPESHHVASHIASLGLGRVVHMVGRLTDEELSRAYSQAIACVVPSWYEGFGFPVLEAFACGCPVVAAVGSSLDEIAGPAMRVNPADTKSIADGMMQAMFLSSGERMSLIARGGEWAADFSWEKTARQTIAVYEKTLHHNSGL